MQRTQKTNCYKNLAVEPTTSKDDNKNKIPIKNIWWLLLFASELFKARDDSAKRFGIENNPKDIPDLVAEILTRAVKRRLLHNLSVDLERKQADLTRVRGRIDHIRTKRHCLLERGRIACLFDYFTADTPRNQYVKAALVKLSRIVTNTELKHSCRVYAAALERAGVIKDLPMSILKTNRSPVAMARTNPEDKQMLDAAKLAVNLWLPTEEPGDLHIPVVDRDKYWLRTLFEKAIGGFYNIYLPHPEWKVHQKERIDWDKKSSTSMIETRLQKMETDIRLERTDKENDVKSWTIIDTKFKSILTKKKHHGEYKFHREDMFQIYAYLRSQENESDPPSLCSSGMLLYPSLGLDVDESTTIQRHRIRFATVNLNANYASIQKRLLKLFSVD